MDYAHIRELQTANGHKATHTTHLNNISSRLQFGTAKVMIQGNTAADGSGNNNMLNVDSDGVATVKMMASGDSGQRQVKTDNSGNVSVYAADNFPIFPANTLNGEHGSHTQSIATMLRGRTDPADHSTGQFIKSTSNAIHTAPVVKRNSQILMASTGLTSNQLYGVFIDATEHQHCRLMGTNLAGNSFTIMGSIFPNSNYFKIGEVFPQSFDGAFHFNSLFENCPPYIRIKNGLSSETFTLHFSLIR